MANKGVTGRVVLPGTETGIAGLKVRAYDIDRLSADDLLGKTATTDNTGRFTINYELSSYRIWFPGENPDIEVRVYGAGGRLLCETKKKDNVTDDVYDVGKIEVHGTNVRVSGRQDPFWLVRHTSLNPANGDPVRLTHGNQIEWLLDGAALFPAVNQDIHRGLKPDGTEDTAATDPVTSIKLINMGFHHELISKFEFPGTHDHQTVVDTDTVTVDRLAKILKAQAAKHVPVNVLVWELEDDIGGGFGSRLDGVDDADELRKFFQTSLVQFGSFKSTQLLHVKFILVDGKTAYIAGSTMKQGYFGDTHHLIHDGRHGVLSNKDAKKGERGLTHDVSLKVQGPCVSFIDQTFSTIWSAGNENTPVPKPTPTPGAVAPVAVQVMRTLPGNVFTTASPNAEVLPHGETGVLEAYQRAIMKAEEYIYIEDQYFNSPEIVNAIKARMIEINTLQVIIVLNPRPDIGGYHAHQTALIKELKAAGGDTRVAVFTMWSCDPRASKLQVAPVYVHSKVAIIDDVWLTVGTANVDGASMNARQWRIILPGTILELLDEGDFKAAMFILWFPLIVLVFLAGFLLPGISAFLVDAVRREFARFTQHANPNREQQPPRHPELNLVVFDGIAGQPASGKVKELRDSLWQEHLGAAPPAAPPQGGWVAHWNKAAEGYLTKIKNAAQTPSPSATFPEKVLRWSPEREFEANLRSLGVPTKQIVVKESGDTTKFKSQETIPPPV
jgi:phosphatidylserine/phosphatidylglycerophosphate/cardiolipin synthase-like enzyme